MSDTRAIGDLTVSELRALEDVQARMDATLRRIGELEVERHRLIASVNAIEVESTRVLESISTRLNIPADTGWAIDRDGTVRTVNP